MMALYLDEFLTALKAKTSEAMFDFPQEATFKSLKIAYEKNCVVIKNPPEGIPSSQMEDIIFNTGDIFDKDIIFDGGNFSKIIFRGGTFNGNLIFRGGTFNGFVSIRGGTFKKKIVFLGGEFKHWVGTLDGHKNKDNPDDKDFLAEEPLKIHSLEIEGGYVTNNFWICGGAIEKLEIKSVTPARIHIKPPDDLLEKDDGSMISKFISKPVIDRLSFIRYFHHDSFVEVSDIQVNELCFEGFTNLGNISITNLEIAPNGMLRIYNAALGKTAIIDSHLRYNRIQFRSSQISTVSIAGSSFPDLDRFETPDQKEVRYQKRQYMRQLKKICEDRKDWANAGKYNAQEMNLHLTVLRQEPRKHFWEIVVLTMNKWTNNHGQSWSRAMLAIIVALAVLFTVYCSMLGHTINLSFSKESLHEFARLAALSPEFLNPIRKTEFLAGAILQTDDNVHMRAEVVFWDNISKIFFAYLIFQFIAAFRKHGKSK